MQKITSKLQDSPRAQKPLTVLEVYQYFVEIASTSGKGSREKKERLLTELLTQVTPLEEKYLIKMIFGEMQHGVNEGVMMQAIAEAVRVKLDLVRRACMFSGDIGEVARIALKQGKAGLEKIALQLFRPIQPMLAELASDLSQVFQEHGGQSALEFKFDGARVQIHKQNDIVKIYSRSLSDVTESLPEIVDSIKQRVKAKEVIVEGEVVAVGRDDRPLPFQELMRRFRRVHDVYKMVKEVPVRLYLFDLMYLDGQSLIDSPYARRWQLLSQVCPAELLAHRMVTNDIAEAERFLNRAMELGHEGLMAKKLDSTYTPGSRGKRWFKIKPAETLDLVIVAADWGYGRRTGWLSNYHLAARNDQTGEFLVIGKTFKGLTDQEFQWMTGKLQSLKISEGPDTVYVKPELVVEVAYNEIQRSPHYKSGFALRFARVTRIREDKSPAQADTLERIRRLYEQQFEKKAKGKDVREFK
ncbi:MAG: ATP-dependent DNA ligase [candidate division KSB1 bacterium]|nr:ATP-dependent DNA ligase [candidate division KSB1 bacterium]